MDSSSNGIVVINAHGIILIYNQSAMRLLRPDKEVPVGMHFSEVMPEAWPDLKNILETGKPQIGKRIPLRHAVIIANRNPIIDEGNVVGVISIFQDISEYEALSSELQSHKQLHRELEAIFESSYDGLYITDGKANTIRVNTAYERITGLCRKDVLGRNMGDLVKERIFDHSVTLAVIEKKSQVTMMQTIKGNTQVMVTGTPMFDDNGEIALIVTNVRDLTLLNELRNELEESRRLSSRYYKSLLEQEQFHYALEDMVIKSEAMGQVIRKAVKVADVETSVLLCGESGVGKSMLARIIHLLSPRKERPFVKINCGAIPESLMESELFGYKKGAFTGALTDGKAGLIEAGNTGTVFLDEIGDLTSAMQVKLLQVLEEKTFTRIGATKPTSVDVRIIAATNKDLKALVKSGLFREDLYYRLSVIPIVIPSLRERPEDIPALVNNILEKFAKNPKYRKRFEPEVIDRLMAYDYPGNVRELINLIERLIVMSEGEVITVNELPGEIRESLPSVQDSSLDGLPLKTAMEVLESRYINSVLKRYGNLSSAAVALGVHHSTLWRKLNRSRG